MNESRHTPIAPFRAPLGVQLSSVSLPLLSCVLAYLEEGHEFGTNRFEDIYIKLVDLLSQVLHDSLHLAYSENDYMTCDNTANLMYEYNTFVRETRTSRSKITAPNFVDLWIELIVTCAHLQASSTGYDTLLCGYVVVNGKRMRGHQALAFEYTQHCDAKYTRLINAIVEKQPVYTDWFSNFPHRIYGNHSGGQTPDQEFFVLQVAFLPFAGNRRSDTMVQDVVVHFSMLLAYTIDLFVATSYTPSLTQTNVLLEATAEAWDDMTSNIFGGTPLAVRRHLALLNVRGITEALVQKCRQLLRERRSSSILGWRLNDWFFANVGSALERCLWPSNPTQDFIIAASDQEFGNRLPVSARSNYILARYRSVRLDRERLAMADQIDDMEDARLVPDGNALDPRDYTNTVVFYDKKELCVICQCEFGDAAVVKLRLCVHILHLECVRTMINRSEPSSNLCPLCREIICPRRPRAQL